MVDADIAGPRAPEFCAETLLPQERPVATVIAWDKAEGTEGALREEMAGAEAADFLVVVADEDDVGPPLAKPGATHADGDERQTGRLNVAHYTWLWQITDDEAVKPLGLKLRQNLLREFPRVFEKVDSPMAVLTRLARDARQ